MYFAKIESDKEASRLYNNSLKANAARRLGEPHNQQAKQVSMDWNRQQKVANGAEKGTINRKQAARLAARKAVWQAMGNGNKSRADHQHHCPGSFN